MSHDPNQVKKPDLRILQCLVQIATKYGRLWAYPTQEKLRELLAKYHGLQISARSLNRHLAALQSQGYLDRIRRHTRAQSGMLILKSTVYRLRAATYGMVSAFVNLSRQLSTETVDRFVHHAVPNTAQKAELYFLFNRSRRRKCTGGALW